MTLIKDALVAKAKAKSPIPNGCGPAYEAYKLVVVGKDTVTSSGQAFTEGQLAIAQPDTFVLAGKKHWAVYSQHTCTHVALPEADVRPA